MADPDEVAALREALETQHARTLAELRAAADEVERVRSEAAEREAELTAELAAVRARLAHIERRIARLPGPLRAAARRAAQGSAPERP